MTLDTVFILQVKCYALHNCKSVFQWNDEDADEEEHLGHSPRLISLCDLLGVTWNPSDQITLHSRNGLPGYFKMKAWACCEILTHEHCFLLFYKERPERMLYLFFYFVFFSLTSFSCISSMAQFFLRRAVFLFFWWRPQLMIVIKVDTKRKTVALACTCVTLTRCGWQINHYTQTHHRLTQDRVQVSGVAVRLSQIRSDLRDWIHKLCSSRSTFRRTRLETHVCIEKKKDCQSGECCSKSSQKSWHRVAYKLRKSTSRGDLYCFIVLVDAVCWLTSRWRSQSGPNTANTASFTTLHKKVCNHVSVVFCAQCSTWGTIEDDRGICFRSSLFLGKMNKKGGQPHSRYASRKKKKQLKVQGVCWCKVEKGWLTRPVTENSA